MSFKTLLITKSSSLRYSAGYLVVNQNGLHKFHMSELDCLIVESNAVTITSYLISELIHNKVCIIFCDSAHNPQSQINALYGSHDSYKKIKTQLGWDEHFKGEVWQAIAREKIKNQMHVLYKYKYTTEGDLLKKYVDEIKCNDITNREGHAAKVYFNALFDKNFTRDKPCAINTALDYGYSILLALFNRAIVSKGYLTQLGIKHIGATNPYNLSSDLMEPFRQIIDYVVIDNINDSFGTEQKILLLSVFEKQFRINNKLQYLTSAIDIYLTSVFKSIQKEDLSLIYFIDYE